MKIFGIDISFNKSEPKADFNYWNGENMTTFDGEKTPMELGTAKDIYVDYYSLRARSWEAFLKTDVVQNAIKKYCLWIIGSGLKLQSDPVEHILLKNNVSKESIAKFISASESNFRLFAKIKESTYNQNQNLHSLGAEALKNAILSGDILCINRYNGKNVTFETIDGYYIQDPLGTKYFDEAIKKGNRIINGVEINDKGTHIAYYILEDGYQYRRIEARSKDNKTIYAWLFYGLKYKNHDVRGTSLLAAVLETANKMDRYKEATLGAAEENAKIPYTIEHNQFSTGENPLAKQLVQSLGKGSGTAPETYEACNSVATKVAQTTEKQVYNMPVGSQLKRNAGPTDKDFGEFFGVNADIVYATIGIPPEVAMDKFGGAYSGSRAALKSWEYKMFVDRTNYLTNQFYKPFYSFWLDIEILKNNIPAPSYLQALNNNDFMILEAYRNCRFIGTTVPHIDPLKEINAERKKLGSDFDTIPLTTAEQSCEALNTGDYSAVVKKAIVEKKLGNEFIIDKNNNNNE